jgi:hypothetical protein
MKYCPNCINADSPMLEAKAAKEQILSAGETLVRLRTTRRL